MEKQVRKLIIEISNNLNYDLNDLEFKKYLYEKIIDVFNKMKPLNYSLEEIKDYIINNVPKMREKYLRIKQAINKKRQMKTNFGVSINYQLVELFKILNTASSCDEFYTMKNQYLKFQPIIFPGLLESSYEEIQNIYKNIIDNCDVITPEAEAKMTLTINDKQKPFNTDGTVNLQVFNFSYLDTIVSFAKHNNMKVRLHTLIWHKHFPKILENCSKEQIIYFLDTYFSTIVNKYGTDIFYTIDVLNEIAANVDEDEEAEGTDNASNADNAGNADNADNADVNDNNNSLEYKQGNILRSSKWKEKLGNDYYLTVLKIARKNFPSSNLAYNEYGETNKEKRKRMKSIINDIKQEEMITNTTLLDTIGLQSHYNEYTIDEKIEDVYRDLTQTGKSLQISEMDVTKIDNHDDIQVERVFRTVLGCSVTYNIDSFTCWGPTSSISWKPKKVRTFLNDKGEIDNCCKLVVEIYSEKMKNRTTDLQNNSVIPSQTYASHL